MTGLLIRGEMNKGYFKKGELHRGWKGGFPHCIDCQKLLKNRGAKRCMSCNYKFRKGENHHNFGKKPTTETIKNIKQGILKKYPYGRIISEDTRKKLAEVQRGEKHWQWKGGITSLTIQIRTCFKYRQWRSDIFTRDNFICVLCRTVGRKLNADHYPKKFSEIIEQYKIRTFNDGLNCEELWNINNGRTLCIDCHRKTTWKNQL